MKDATKKFTIGRDAGCDIRIADDSVSRVHAELMVAADGSVLLRDCGSSNGTRVVRNGKPDPIRQESVRASDQVQFGDASVAVADLLSVIEQKFSGVVPARDRWKSPSPSKANKLVRCECGTIKPAHQPCPECGQ